MKVYSNELQHGEIYKTKKEGVWSDWDKKLSRVTVPENQTLMFRSFQPYNNSKDSELALFVWLEKKMTICLVVNSPRSYFEIEHIDWDKYQKVNRKIAI